MATPPAILVSRYSLALRHHQSMAASADKGAPARQLFTECRQVLAEGLRTNGRSVDSRGIAHGMVHRSKWTPYPGQYLKNRVYNDFFCSDFSQKQTGRESDPDSQANYTWACVLCRPSPEFPFRFIWVLAIRLCPPKQLN